MNEKIAPDTKRDGTEAARRDQAKTDGTFRVLDVRENDIVLEMEDGRAFIAKLGDGVKAEDAKRGMRATITSDGMDRSDAPKDAVVTRLAPKE